MKGARRNEPGVVECAVCHYPVRAATGAHVLWDDGESRLARFEHENRESVEETVEKATGGTP